MVVRTFGGVPKLAGKCMVTGFEGYRFFVSYLLLVHAAVLS